METTPSPLSRLSLRSKLLIALGILILLVAIGSLFYGFSQRSKFVQEQYQRQITSEKEKSKKLDQQLTEQSKGMTAMQSRMDALITSTLSSSKNRDEMTIRTVYLPGTDKVVERTETRIIEKEDTKADTKSETHSTQASTATIETAATTTVAVVETDKQKTSDVTSSTSTVIITPSGGGEKRDMRVSVGIAYKEKIIPAAAYSVKAFGIGDIISVWSGIVAGNDLLGGAVQFDAMKLPRIGVGYGCDFKIKKCKNIFTMGLRLDF